MIFMEENKITFEQAIKRLEEIVRFLERGDAPIDESLAAFEEGVKLVKICNNELDSAEKKVKLLTFSDDGAVGEVDMPEMENK